LILKNKISLLSVFGFGLLIGSVCIGLFAHSQKRLDIPDTYNEPEEAALNVVTDISNYYSFQKIVDHRDRQLTTLNSRAPLFGNCHLGDGETHRIEYHDTWFKNAFSLTLTNRNDAIKAEWKKLIDNHDLKRFEYTESQRSEVSTQDWKAFRATLRSTKFLEMPPMLYDENGFPLIGLDGDSWTIESCVNGRYHYAYRWTPYGKEFDSFRSVGYSMVKAGGNVFQLPLPYSDE
jgi:hypothetical protein